MFVFVVVLNFVYCHNIMSFLTPPKNIAKMIKIGNAKEVYHCRSKYGIPKGPITEKIRVDLSTRNPHVILLWFKVSQTFFYTTPGITLWDIKFTVTPITSYTHITSLFNLHLKIIQITFQPTIKTETVVFWLQLIVKRLNLKS